ncbi:hypothetical protein LSAT2_029950, partial [Lamellibrachia satsuma]
MWSCSCTHLTDFTTERCLELARQTLVGDRLTSVFGQYGPERQEQRPSDHSEDRQAGAAECRRARTPDGRLTLHGASRTRRVQFADRNIRLDFNCTPQTIKVVSCAFVWVLKCIIWVANIWSHDM